MKKITTLLVMLFVCFGLTAQTTMKVQGVPRESLQGIVTRSGDVIPGVDFNKILFWVGNGEKRSALVIKWDDEKGEDHNLVWGYQWTTNEEGTGEAMLRAIAKADPRFYLLAYGNTQYGAAFGGIGYDLNGDGNVGLMKNGQRYELTDGICFTSGYDFDDYTAIDANDHWRSGWMTLGYWSYWTADNVNSAYGYAPVGASSHTLTDGSVDGWSFCLLTSFEGNDMSGTLEYISKPVAARDYTKGTFFVNEGWYGHQNSTVNFLTENGEWVYRAFQKENPGKELGATCQFGTIYGDKFYFVAKQPKDPGADITGGRLTVCDARTLKCIKQFETISTDDKGNSNADGRSFLGVDEHKGYISTSNGIYVYDTDNMEIKGKLSGSDNPEDEGYGSLYRGQVGTMVRVNESVFAVHQSVGIIVIDPETDKVKKIIAGPEKWGYGSIVLSKDGNLWASVANPSGSGQVAPFIFKINPATCDTTRIHIPEEYYGPANSWYAWTPDCFCASKQQNVLYWNGGKNSWFSNATIYKYDIDKNEFGVFVDLSNDPEKWLVYGCSFRMDPVSDHAYVSLFHSFGDDTYITRVYKNNGEKLGEYAMINNYWFPALPMFPDNAAPVVASIEKQTVDSQHPFTISLTALASDADNMDAAIVKRVETVSDEEILKAAIVAGDLNIIPQGKKGDADVTVKINSNGKLAEAVIAVSITSDATGIGEDEWIVRSAYSKDRILFIQNCEGYDFVLYNTSGRQVTSFRADSGNFSYESNVTPGIYFLKGTANEKEPVSFKVLIP